MTINLKAIRAAAEAANLYWPPETEIRSGRWSAIDELINAMAPQTVIALLDRLEAAEKDAARYRWLREQHWSTDVIGVLVRPKTHSHLGSIFPSLKLLDDTIDHMMEKLK